jgi:hypothetical protein
LGGAVGRRVAHGFSEPAARFWPRQELDEGVPGVEVRRDLVPRHCENSPAALEHFVSIAQLRSALPSEVVRLQVLARRVAAARRVPRFLSPSSEPSFERTALPSDAGRG